LLHSDTAPAIYAGTPRRQTGHEDTSDKTIIGKTPVDLDCGGVTTAGAIDLSVTFFI
jgi:hypothetical protein